MSTKKDMSTKKEQDPVIEAHRAAFIAQAIIDLQAASEAVKDNPALKSHVKGLVDCASDLKKKESTDVEYLEGLAENISGEARAYIRNAVACIARMPGHQE
jgi:hypothetical protein